MREFKVGELYFMLWYPEASNAYLVPDSIVFIGKNIEQDSEPADSWYFQDTDSYCDSGPYSGTKKSHTSAKRADMRLYRLRDGDLGQVVDSEELCVALTQCAKRRAALKT